MYSGVGKQVQINWFSYPLYYMYVLFISLYAYVLIWDCLALIKLHFCIYFTRATQLCLLLCVSFPYMCVLTSSVVYCGFDPGPV